jgi:hypothetical protein
LSSELGLDKLGFLLPVEDVRISPDFPARVGSSINAATGETMTPRRLYRDTGGREVTGSLASFNTPNYQFTVKPDRAGEGSIALVQFSAGAFSDNNLEPLGRDRTLDVTRAVQRDLQEHGVKLDLERAKVVRADIARNVALSRPVACYAPALTAVGARKRTRKMDFGGTGFVVGNKSWEIGFYDKAQEMVDKGYDSADCPANTLRAEYRSMKFRLTCVQDVDRNVTNLIRGWDTLRPDYNQAMKREVFRPKLEATKEQAPDFNKLAGEVKKTGERRLWQRFKSEAMLMLIVQHMGLEAAKEFAATEFGFDRRTKSGERQIERMNAELDRAAFALSMDRTNEDGDSILALYDELAAAVLGG